MIYLDKGEVKVVWEKAADGKWERNFKLSFLSSLFINQTKPSFFVDSNLPNHALSRTLRR